MFFFHIECSINNQLTKNSCFWIDLINLINLVHDILSFYKIQFIIEKNYNKNILDFMLNTIDTPQCHSIKEAIQCNVIMFF